jgi:hypothetical protein
MTDSKRDVEAKASKIAADAYNFTKEAFEANFNELVKTTSSEFQTAMSAGVHAALTIIIGRLESAIVRRVPADVASTIEAQNTLMEDRNTNIATGFKSAEKAQDAWAEKTQQIEDLLSSGASEEDIDAELAKLAEEVEPVSEKKEEASPKVGEKFFPGYGLFGGTGATGGRGHD